MKIDITIYSSTLGITSEQVFRLASEITDKIRGAVPNSTNVAVTVDTGTDGDISVMADSSLTESIARDAIDTVWRYGKWRNP